MTELIVKRIFNQPIPEEWISQIEDHVEDMMKPVIRRVAHEAATEVLQSVSVSHAESVGALEEPPEPREGCQGHVGRIESGREFQQPLILIS